MRCNCFTKPTRIFAGLLTGLLFAILASSTRRRRRRPKPARDSGFGPVYDAAHETTLNGTIQEVVTKHTPAAPPGCICWWPDPGRGRYPCRTFLSKKTKEALQAGMPVQIVGATSAAARKRIFPGPTDDRRRPHRHHPQHPGSSSLFRVPKVSGS